MQTYHEYYFPKLIIGNNLSALVYSYLYNIPIVKTSISSILPIDFLPLDIDLKTYFNIPKITNRLISLNGEEKTFGWQKSYIYKRLSFVLSLSGLNFLSDKFVLMRLDSEEKKIVITISKEKVVRIRYNQLYIFNEEGINGLPPVIKKQDNKKQVVDWFFSMCCEPHNLYYLKNNSQIINEVFFYDSVYNKTRNLDKDLIVTSIIDEKDLSEFEYSPTFIMLSLIKLLNSFGIHGIKKGYRYYPDKEPKQRYRAMNFEHEIRQVRDIRKNIYEEVGGITWCLDLKEEKIISEFEGIIDKNLKRLMFDLFVRPEVFEEKKFEDYNLEQQKRWIGKHFS